MRGLVPKDTVVFKATAVVLGLAKSYKLGFGTCFTNMCFVFCKRITRTQSGVQVRKRQRRARRTGAVGGDGTPLLTASDGSFRRKLLKHLGSSSDPTTERVRVKEGDRIHIPRFPKPEQYRNWRIKVRDPLLINRRRHLSGLKKHGSLVRRPKSFVIQAFSFISMRSWHRH